MPKQFCSSCGFIFFSFSTSNVKTEEYFPILWVFFFILLVQAPIWETSKIHFHFFFEKFWSPPLAQRDITVYPTLRFGLVIKSGFPELARKFSGFSFKSVCIYSMVMRPKNLKAGGFVRDLFYISEKHQRVPWPVVVMMEFWTENLIPYLADAQSPLACLGLGTWETGEWWWHRLW